MNLILLGAGFATRMYPLTLTKPKCLLPVGGKPILTRIIDKFAADKVSIEAAHVVTNAKFYDDFAAWQRKLSYKFPVHIVNDGSTDNSNRLGATGDIKLTIERQNIDSDTIIAAGDNLINFDLSEFTRFSIEKRLTLAVKDLKGRQNLSLYGIVLIDKDNLVTDFEEKPAKPKSSLIATGIYFFGKENIGKIAEYANTGQSLDKSGELMGWLSKNAKLYAYKIKGQWYDIGDINTYKEVCDLYGG